MSQLLQRLDADTSVARTVYDAWRHMCLARRREKNTLASSMDVCEKQHSSSHCHPQASSAMEALQEAVLAMHAFRVLRNSWRQMRCACRKVRLHAEGRLRAILYAWCVAASRSKRVRLCELATVSQNSRKVLRNCLHRAIDGLVFAAASTIVLRCFVAWKHWRHTFCRVEVARQHNYLNAAWRSKRKAELSSKWAALLILQRVFAVWVSNAVNSMWVQDRENHWGQLDILLFSLDYFSL